MYLIDEGDQNDSEVQHKQGKYLLSYALFSENKIDYTDQVIDFNKWNKPFLRDYPDIHYNISHCNGLVTCVLADVPVGIDVEKIKPFSLNAAKHVCDEQEIRDIEFSENPDRRFFMYWTLKESCVKAMGCGISYPMKKVVFRLCGNDIKCITQHEYQFMLIEDSSFIIAVCYKRSGRSVRIFEENVIGGDTLHGKTL